MRQLLICDRNADNESLNFAVVSHTEQPPHRRQRREGQLLTFMFHRADLMFSGLIRISVYFLYLTAMYYINI